MIHSFYQVDEQGSRMNRLRFSDIDWGDWKSYIFSGWARLTNFSAGIDMRLRGTAKSGVTPTSGEIEEDESSGTGVNLQTVAGDRLTMDEQVSGLNIPWDLTATLRYTLDQRNPLNKRETFWANTSLNFNITKHWKISYRARFDVLEKDIVSQDLVFYRDLHCWEARIVWTPTGLYKRIYFRINVKSAMLQDIKIEKGSGRSMLYGY
jgi:hypothetical protein